MESLEVPKRPVDDQFSAIGPGDADHESLERTQHRGVRDVSKLTSVVPLTGVQDAVKELTFSFGAAL